MFAALKSQIKVEDLLRGLAIMSGNDSCIILAEGIAGNESAFTEMMTKRAREIGLTQASFGNSSGISDPNNLMTVREIAKLARHVIKTHPEFYPLFSEREFTWNKIRQQNRNPLINTMPGVDGFMSGQTKEGQLRHGRVGAAERPAPDRGRQRRGRSRRPEHRDQEAARLGLSRISSRGRCSRPIRSWGRQKSLAARLRRSD